MIRAAAIAAVIALACFSPVAGEVRLAGIFGDHMVLQRGRSLSIWGTATPGEQVAVHAGSQRHITKAGADGRWRAMLDPLPAPGPIEFRVEGSANAILLNDVLVGDVWICAGQSNMDFPLWMAKDADRQIAAADHPRLRLYIVPDRAADRPQLDLSGHWDVCTPKTAGGFSAVGYFFGREIHRQTDLPIGLIRCSKGATPAEMWADAASLASDPELAASARQNGGSTLYNGMVSPLVPFGITGVIWYQGESNVDRAAQYRRLLTSLIAGWRRNWGQGDFPFIIVQLANYGPPAQATPATTRP